MPRPEPVEKKEGIEGWDEEILFTKYSMERECIDNGVLDRGCWIGNSTCCSASRDCSSATVRCNVSAHRGGVGIGRKGQC